MKNNKEPRVNRLDSYLKEKGMTRADLSRLTGISESTIIYWTQGSEPRVTAVVKAAAALQISIKQFLRLLDLPDCPIDLVPDDRRDPETADELKARLTVELKADLKKYLHESLEQYGK